MTMQYHYRPKPQPVQKLVSKSGRMHRMKPTVPYDNRFHHHIDILFVRSEWGGWQRFSEACLYPGSVWCYHALGLGNYDLRNSTFMFRTKEDALLFKLSHVQSQT